MQHIYKRSYYYIQVDACLWYIIIVLEPYFYYNAVWLKTLEFGELVYRTYHIPQKYHHLHGRLYNTLSVIQFSITTLFVIMTVHLGILLILQILMTSHFRYNVQSCID